jgi:hypothetical protein
MESASTDEQVMKSARAGAPSMEKIWRLRNEVALILVALSLSGAVVIIPRPTYPQILPLPAIDGQQIHAREQEEIRRALSVADGSLDNDARAIGEQVRRVGRTLSTNDFITGPQLEAVRREARALLDREKTASLPAGTEALLNLRALQGQLFLDAVESWRKTGNVTDELRELGGPFHNIARDAWIEEASLSLDQDELRLFFRIHWGKVTGLFGVTPFGPSHEELRRYYFSNLIHPPGAKGDLMSQTLSQIGFVRALAKIEPSYPVLLAEGILQLRLGQSLPALRNLTAHLEKHPDGPWAHIARNHAILAARQADEIAKAGP